jgi:hypothetical protein
MPRASELPADLDPEQLDEMIRDLGREKGLPPGIHPDLVGPDPEDHDYWGCGQQDRHRQSCIWRRKLIAELTQRPEWIADWRADRELDRRIEALCEAKGLHFQPWELTPWSVSTDGEPHPTYPDGHLVRKQWGMAQRLRRQLLRELEGEG